MSTMTEAEASETMLTFRVSVTEANMITTQLGELPANRSMGLILKLQAQARPQLEKAQEKPAEQPVAPPAANPAMPTNEVPKENLA